MNCSLIKSRLIAYINGEVSPLEKEAIQAHLVDCLICQGEMQMLSNLENRLTQHLRLQAERAHPTPQSWNALKASLLRERSTKAFAGFESIFKLLRFEKQTIFKVAVALMVIAVLLLANPSVLTMAARISDWIGNWFHFSTPTTVCNMSVGGFDAFTPYVPHYLPEEFYCDGLGGTTGPDFNRLELTASRDEKFVQLLQSKGSGKSGPPKGESIDINGHSGILVWDFASSSGELQTKIPGIPIVTNFAYERTNLLVWYIGEIKIELVSNLPKAEILKIAQSLALVDNSER